jgi:hypothetical protein
VTDVVAVDEGGCHANVVWVVHGDPCACSSEMFGERGSDAAVAEYEYALLGE